MTMKDKLGSGLKGLLKTGFFHIFASSAVNRALAVILSFVLVRILTKDAYGAYAYAFNIASFFVVINGLGIPSAILQICSELFKDSRLADMVYAYAYRSSICVDVVMGAVIALIGIFVPLKIEGAGQLLALYCIYPLAMLLFDIKSMRLRVLLMNREYALATNVQSLLLTAMTILGALLAGPTGLILGQTFSYLVAYGLLCLRFPFKAPRPLHLTTRMRKDFWSISCISALNNGLSQMLTLTGTFFVGQFLSDGASVASYQVATLIPFGLLFIPGAIVTYAYPYFARHCRDRAWTLRNYLRITGGCIILMGVTALVFALLTEPVVCILFGSQYLNCVPIMRLLLIGFFITATFGRPVGNLLLTQRKFTTNTAVGAATVILNVIASVLLIPTFGMEGAACTYILSMAFSAAVSTICYVRTILRLPKEPDAA